MPSNTPSNAAPVIALLSRTHNMRRVAQALAAEMPKASIRIMDPENGAENLGDLSEVDLTVCWQPPHGVMARMPKLKLIQSLAAGIDHIVADPQLPDLPLCRIVDPHMASGMAAYVAWAVTHQHRDMGDYLASAAKHEWRERPVQPASGYQVGIAGLGVLGLHCAKTLATIGYPVRGWSRSPKDDLPEGITGFAGQEQLPQFLNGLDALICLLPLTPATHGFLNQGIFQQLKPGAHLINVGRGEQQVEADILQALTNGQLGHATLDVFAQEPLPPEHPFWGHAQITITPHIATNTSAGVIAEQTRSNYEALLQGLPLTRQVNLQQGY